MKEQLDQELFERIEAYLNDELNQAEREQFEQEMENDASLREEIEAMRENIFAVELGAFSASLKELGSDYAKKNPSIDSAKNKSRFPGRLFAIAAGIALVVSIALWLNNSTSTNQEVFAAHFSPDPGLPVSMGVTDNYDFKDAMVDYRAEKYKTASEKWNALLKSAPGNDTLLYYIGSAELNQGNAAQSIELFEKVLLIEGSTWTEKAQWYLALAYINEGRYDSLKALDVSENEYYGKRINELKAIIDQL